MTIAREEIFGPVLVMIPYSTVDEAIEIATDSVYGLCGYVYGASKDEADTSNPVTVANGALTASKSFSKSRQL
jgi:aldehyde dehydrogenase (NAD+)